MLTANKSVIFEKLFSIYNRNLLKRRFTSFRVNGLAHLLNKTPHLPLLIYCNHSSWWDGLVAFQISRETCLDGFIMMDEKQLKKLFLFRFLGAFSVKKDSPREALKSIDYAAKILSEKPGRTVWIFPQGEILPNEQRPLKFYNGISRIIRKTGRCLTASLSMKYEFLGHYKPQIFVKIERPEMIEAGEDFRLKPQTEKLAECLTANLNELKNDLVRQDLSNYKPII